LWLAAAASRAALRIISFFWPGRVKLQGALRGGAAGLSCGLAARDGQKRASRVHTGLWRTGIAQRGAPGG